MSRKTVMNGVKGMPKLPNIMKVMWELWFYLDTRSPGCLYGHATLNAQFIANLNQKAKWVRTWTDEMEINCHELSLVAKQLGVDQCGDGSVSRGDGDTRPPADAEAPEGFFEQFEVDEVEQAPPCEVEGVAQKAPEGAEEVR